MTVLAFCRKVLVAFRPYWVLSSVVLVGVLIEMALTTTIPLSFKYLIDTGIGQRDRGALMTVLGGLCAAVVTVGVVGVGRDYLYARVVTASLNDLRLRMFRHLQGLSADYYARTRTGDILARFSTDISAVEHALSIAIGWAVLPLLQAVLGSILLVLVDWQLAVVAALVFPLVVFGPRFVAPRATRASYRRKEDEARTLTDVEESTTSQMVVKAFGVEERFEEQFRHSTGALFDSSVRVGFLTAVLERSAVIGILVVQVLVMGVGILRVYDGALSLGSLVAFQALFVLLSTSLGYVAEFVPHLVKATGGMQRIEELLAELPTIAEDQEAAELPRLSRELRFSGVSFGYRPDSAPSLHDVSFTLPAHTSAAVVGTSGSGKSTLVNLLARLYDPGAGSITFDGVDVRRATIRSLRDQLGLVFQDSVLFSGTVAENIRVGRPGATDAQVREAVRAVDLHGFVSGLPDGYQTVVGPGGRQLSGGQRQRLAIARVLVRDPAVLVLDEATSALDPASDRAIQATIEEQARTRTLLVITHRLVQIRTLDRIFVLDAGRLVEQGSHHELLALGGVYRRLWSKQVGLAAEPDVALTEEGSGMGRP